MPSEAQRSACLLNMLQKPWLHELHSAPALEVVQLGGHSATKLGLDGRFPLGAKLRIQGNGRFSRWFTR